MRRAIPRSLVVSLPMLCVAAMGLGGCSALTIDVDMYKGPLSNHEAVQAEQLGATIIGAKPILLALRNDLEWERDLPRYKEKRLEMYTQAMRWCREQETKRGVPVSVVCPDHNAWKAFRECERALGLYEHDFWPMPDDGDPNALWLLDSDAIRVNAVLGLYCDITAENMRSPLKRSNDASSAYAYRRPSWSPTGNLIVRSGRNAKVNSPGCRAIWALCVTT